MTLEERHEKLLDDIRELLRRCKISLQACERLLKQNPNSDFAITEIERNNRDIAIFEQLLRNDWERELYGETKEI